MVPPIFHSGKSKFVLSAKYHTMHMYGGKRNMYDLQLSQRLCIIKKFSGYQLCQLFKRQKNQHFKDNHCPHLQGTDVSGESVRVRYRLARVLCS
jgi:hypothetical protein